MTVTGPMTRSDRVATLEEAKAQLRKVGTPGRPGRSWKRSISAALIGGTDAVLRAAAYGRGRLVRMVRPQWPYPAARKQSLSDESGGYSRARKVAGEARPSEGQSAQASAEGGRADTRLRRPADIFG
jgi:hypothetical protein